ncbi:MAG: hypothetical protein LKF61_00830 [Eggerthellaceae bacterium]|jgi:hypothetical protein|nr:hypothetical protein [Eggerthellaceae bacterium]MCH4220487.1 hypothetical protein [Eggerthellaceae bacterium]
MNISLAKNVETIRWSDEPGAKEYTIDFTDGGLHKMSDAMEAIQEPLRKMSESPENAAKAIEDFVTIVAGKECYEDALEYVDKSGAGAKDCNTSLVPLVTALADLVTKHLSAYKSEAMQKYLRAGSNDLV